MTPEQLLEDVARAYDKANPFLLRSDADSAIRAALAVAIEACAKVADMSGPSADKTEFGRAYARGRIDAAERIRALKPKD